MTLKISILVISLLGMSATFMPWVYYPKADESLYGYIGDGIVSLILFFLVAVFALLSKKASKSNLLPISNIALSALLVLFSASKYREFLLSKQSFSDNPLYNIATAGFQLGAGVHVLTFASIVLFFLSCIYLWVKVKKSDSQVVRPMYKWGLAALALVMLAAIGYNFRHAIYNPTSDEAQVEVQIAEEFNEMKTHLLSGNYEAYLEYVNPLIIESIGGSEEMITMLTDTRTYMDEESILITKIDFNGVNQVVVNGGEIQSSISQVIEYSNQGDVKVENQELIAISNNNGESWVFANTNGKSMDEMKKIIPSLVLN